MRSGSRIQHRVPGARDRERHTRAGQPVAERLGLPRGPARRAPDFVVARNGSAAEHRGVQRVQPSEQRSGGLQHQHDQPAFHAAWPVLVAALLAAPGAVRREVLVLAPFRDRARAPRRVRPCEVVGSEHPRPRLAACSGKGNSRP